MLDTGASRSIISEAVYDKIADDVRPGLDKGVRGPQLYLADGTPLATRGCMKIQLKMENGTVTVEHEVIVGAISDQGILGLDFLRTHNCQIDLSGNEVTVAGERVSCRRVQSDPVSKVILSEDSVIPAKSEMIVTASVDNISSGSCFVLDPSVNFVDKFEVQVASSLNEAAGDQVPVRVMNPGEDNVHLYKGTVVAHAQQVEVVIPFLEAENEPGPDASTGCNIRKVSNDTTDSGWPTASVEPAESITGKVPDHIRELFDRSTCNLSDIDAQKLAELLVTFQDAFATSSSDLGRTTITEHRIDTGHSHPIRQRPRRTPLAFKGEEEEEIKKMLKKGVIRESTSPWSSPVVLVRKKDGSVRFCIDYRQLNSVTVKDSYPLPRIEDCFDALAGATLFSTMDLASGYWQIKMHPDDQLKTAFVTKSGLYHFTVLPFGLVNAPSTFERCMETVLRGLQWQTCLLYLDDIIVFAKSLDQHLVRLKEVLQRIKAAGLKLNPPKCNLLQTSVPFLGHVISGTGVSTDPRKIVAVQSWAVPENVSQLRSFLGFCSYYRRFIANFAQIASPLSSLTRKDKEFVWSSSCQEAFESLKGKLTSAPILCFPSDEGLFILDTDASGFGIGAVLSQIQGQQEKVISYASRTLNKSERNYCVTRRELLAIVHFLQHYRHYLLGRQFLIRCDHQPLKWIFSLRDPNGQVARWLEQLASYDFTIEYRPGKKHTNADGMSRCICDPRSCQCSDSLPCGPCNKCLRNSENMLTKVFRIGTRQQSSTAETPAGEGNTRYSDPYLKELQEQDPDIGPVLLWKLESPTRPKSQDVVFRSPATRNLWLIWESLHVKNGVLYKKARDGRLQLVVPQAIRTELIEMMHAGLLAGHLGYKKTLSRLTQKYHWYHVKEDVYTWVQKCLTCGANCKASHKPKAPLGDLRVGAPMDRLGIDLLGPFPVTPRGNKLIMVVQDYFTKWVEAYPIPDGTAQTCARILVNDFLARFGMPLVLHSDQGRNFESDLFQEMCRLLNIKKTRTSPRHPSCNGMVERFNSTLVKMIKAFLAGRQCNWDVNLGCLTAAYRSSQHESTGFSPNMLMLGREVQCPAELVYGEPPQDSPDSYGEHVQQLREDLCRAHELTRTHLKQAAQRQKHNYDVKLSTNTYSIGNPVWFLNEKRTVKRCPKLQNMWAGPCIITRKNSDLNYEIQIKAKGKRTVVHHDKLKPYTGQTLPDWIKTLASQLLK